jgi:hypothetical protein
VPYKIVEIIEVSNAVGGHISYNIHAYTYPVLTEQLGKMYSILYLFTWVEA